jgi:hypothetical protein
MSEATLARRARELREEHRRTSPLAGVAWPSSLEETAPTWGDRIFAVAFVAAGALLVAAILVGFLAPEGCPPAEAILGDAHACDEYVRGEAYWNHRLGVPSDATTLNTITE